MSLKNTENKNNNNDDEIYAKKTINQIGKNTKNPDAAPEKHGF